MNFKINLSILYNASEIALYTCFQKEVLVEGMHLKNQQDSSVTCSHLKIIQVACEKHCTKPKLV